MFNFEPIWPNLDAKFDIPALLKWKEEGLSGLAPKWVNPGLFQITFQYILAQRQNVLKSDLKSPTFDPFGTNLTYFRSKSGHRALDRSAVNLYLKVKQEVAAMT